MNKYGIEELRLIEQGDVLLYEVDRLPDGLKPKKANKESLAIFAFGEATGHHHSAVIDETGEVPNIELFEDSDGVLWCRVNEETIITHQEHDVVTLSPGFYHSRIVQEYDHLADEVRSVQD